MNETRITEKQFAAATLVSLLSPLLRLLPQTAVGFAGRGAWLSLIPALVPLVLLTAVILSFQRHMRPGEGMGGLLLRWLGPVFGRLALLVYGGWFLFYAGFILRSGAERLVSTVYPSSGPSLFVAVTIVLSLVVALGDLRAATRAAVIFRAVLVSALVLVIALSVSNMDPEKLLPVGMDDAGPIALGALPFASVGALAACFSFLYGYADLPKKGGKWLCQPIGMLLVLGGLICASVLSVFGPELTATLTYPFFIRIRSISLWDLVPRIEAVVIAAWVGTDFMLCVGLLRCAHEALRPVFGYPMPDGRPMLDLSAGRYLLWLEGLAVLGCSCIFDLPPWQMRLWSDRYIPLASDCVLYGGFLLLWVVTLPKRKKEKDLVKQRSGAS